MSKERLIIGMSGASGIPLAHELLLALREFPDLEIHLVLSDGARRTIEHECGVGEAAFTALADVVYDNRDIGAAIASGSYRTSGMVVVPCSMKTLAGIACGYSDNLLLRAADVVLKERRRLILVTRECPLHTIHLRNMTVLSEMGAVILPPMLTYYNNPVTVEDMTRHIVGKILDQLGLDYRFFGRWGGAGE